MKRRTLKTNRGGTELPRFSQISMAITIAVTALMLCSGCGGSDPRGVRVGVHGQVQLDGQPLQAGAIVFHCGDGDDKRTAVGYIEDGAYEIASGEGPLVGTARVEFQPKPIEQEQFEAAIERAARTRRRVSLAVVAIPRQYGANSTLTATVTEDGKNQFDFDLKSRL